MIRFAIKSALALGILAAVVPLGAGERGESSNVDLFGLAVGVQQAVTDLGGFCERAPQACSAAREVAAYTGERVEEGVRAGYAYLTEPAEPAPGHEQPEPKLAAGSAPDPLTTGAVDGFPLPRPYLPPKQTPTVLLSSETPLPPTVIGGIAVPSPAPRG